MTAAEFAKLADAATPGPWRWNAQREMESATALSDAEFDSEPYPEKIIITDGGYYPPRTADAAFIAACGTERQRIHRALLLLEAVEDYARSEHAGYKVAANHFLYLIDRRIKDAASKETGTRL
jgi:hypothetical protein